MVFEGLLCMRQAHGFAFGKSDLFMLCSAKLDSRTQHDLDDSGRPRIVPCDKVCSAGTFYCAAVDQCNRCIVWEPLAEYGVYSGTSRDNPIAGSTDKE